MRRRAAINAEVAECWLVDALCQPFTTFQKNGVKGKTSRLPIQIEIPAEKHSEDLATRGHRSHVAAVLGSGKWLPAFSGIGSVVPRSPHRARDTYIGDVTANADVLAFVASG